LPSLVGQWNGKERVEGQIEPSADVPSCTADTIATCRRRDRLKRATPPKDTEMDRQVAGALYAAAMVAVIVGVDLAFFRNRFWERLIVNVGVVLVFAAFYLRFFRRS
jgi:hypothetical protein